MGATLGGDRGASSDDVACRTSGRSGVLLSLRSASNDKVSLGEPIIDAKYIVYTQFVSKTSHMTST